MRQWPWVSTEEREVYDAEIKQAYVEKTVLQPCSISSCETQETSNKRPAWYMIQCDDSLDSMSVLLIQH